MRRTALALTLATITAACASAPLAPVQPPQPTFQQKLGWILRLEDQRSLRDPAPPTPPPAPPIVTGGRRQAAVVVAPPPPSPDLTRLLSDGEARVRRRAALAIGRAGLVDGVQPLAAVLHDADFEVRQMAAFALGLIGDRSARDALVTALDDPSDAVKGSAVEALGLIGDPASAPAIARVVGQVVESGALSAPPPDGADAERDTPAGIFRLGVYALTKLKAYDALAAVVLDGRGEPRVRWWPVAFALQRLEDRRAAPALLTLVKEPHPYTKAFAVKGLGALKDPTAVPLLLPLVTGPDRVLAVEAVRALGKIGDPASAPSLIRLIRDGAALQILRSEAALAIGSVHADGVYDTLIDALGDRNPAVRAGVLGSLATFDQESFVTILSGLDPDPQWTVRAALAEALGSLPPETGLPRLRAMLGDADQRVIPTVLAALGKLGAPDAADVLIDHLKAEDIAVRGAAAEALGKLKPSNGAAALVDAYRSASGDPTYTVRAAALAALVNYGAQAAVGPLTEALSDKDWALRLRAATLLTQLDPSTDAKARIRPVPSARAPEAYDAPALIDPPFSTQAYIDTDKGTIQLELAMLDAPLTVDNFVTLARKHFFDGLTFHRVVSGFVIQGGDPRGDGEGGPGYTIRDEINQRPYLRGTVGMALDWADTGGSQFFITHSPQPHLDGRYTVFGRVLSGMEVVDQIEAGDVIRRVRIWDGEAATN